MSDIVADVFAEGRGGGVVPEGVVSLSVSPFSSRGGFVVWSVVVTAFVECFLLWGLGRIMLCLMKGMTVVY